MEDPLATSCDDLCCLAQGYLRFGQPQRAFVLLMVAMHMGPPPARLLLLCAKCFFALGQADQAQAVLERHDGLYPPSRASRFLMARARRELAQPNNTPTLSRNDESVPASAHTSPFALEQSA